MSASTAATGPSMFPQFSNLPLELRNQIWYDALVENDTPALFPYRGGCWDPVDMSPSDPGYVANHENISLRFNVAHLEPVEMDVTVSLANNEARARAFTWARINQLEVYFCQKRGRYVFARRFDSSRDTVFVGLTTFADFFVEPYNRIADPDLFGRVVSCGKSPRRVAVHEAMLKRMTGALEEMFEWFRSLEEIFVIVNAPQSIEAGDRWEIEETNGKALVYDYTYGRFKWDDGKDICHMDIYRRIEEASMHLSLIFTAKHIVTLIAIRPVFAARRWT